MLHCFQVIAGHFSYFIAKSPVYDSVLAQKLYFISDENTYKHYISPWLKLADTFDFLSPHHLGE